MMLAYKYLNRPVKFENKNVVVVAVENKDLFRLAIMSLVNGNEEELFVISKNFVPLDYGKQVCFVQNPLILEMKNKRLQSSVNSRLASALNELYFKEFDSVQNSISNLILKLSEEADFNFCPSREVDALSLVKFLDFEPAFSNDDNDCLMNLLFYMELMKKHLNIECFIVSNLFLLFSEEELELFFYSLKLKNIYLAVIENSAPSFPSDYFKLAVVDSSLCTIIDD